MLPDPPVYVTEDDKNWTLCAPTTSDFLSAALAYEGVFTFEYNPEEFYWLTETELGLIQSRLTKLPFEITNWLCGMRITLYSNEPDNMVAVMDCGDWELHGDGVSIDRLFVVDTDSQLVPLVLQYLIEGPFAVLPFVVGKLHPFIP